MSVNIVSRPCRERGRDKLYNTWHRVSEGAELLLVLEGSGSVVFKSGIYPLVEGGLYYISGSALHYTLPDDTSKYDRIKMLVGLPVISADKDISSFLSEKEAVFARLSPEKTEKAKALFETIASENDSFMKNAESLSCALALLVMLCRNSNGELKSTYDAMSNVLRYINEKISERIDIDSLCEVVHMSKYHLCRKFKKHMGITIMQYITDTRVELAKDMLIGKEKISVSEVSEKCGFTNVSYFCAIFKKVTGLSPLEYRKDNIK